MNLKGQAQFIGWVLLIGFAVMLAAFVGNWILQQARETTESAVDLYSKDAKCADVSIAIHCVEGQAKVVNTGYFTIKQLACYEIGGGYNPKSIEIPPNSESSESLNSCESIVPIVESEGKLVGCSEKQIEVNCGEEGN